MTLKSVLAVLAAAAVGFFLGWLLWGLVLIDFFKSNMTFYEGLMEEEPSILTYIIGNLSTGVMLVYVLSIAGYKSFGKGFLAGLIITFLFALTIDSYFYGGMNLWTFQAMIVDVLINAMVGGLMAGVAGLILGTGKES